MIVSATEPATSYANRRTSGKLAATEGAVSGRDSTSIATFARYATGLYRGLTGEEWAEYTRTNKKDPLGCESF